MSIYNHSTFVKNNLISLQNSNNYEDKYIDSQIKHNKNTKSTLARKFLAVSAVTYLGFGINSDTTNEAKAYETDTNTPLTSSILGPIYTELVSEARTKYPDRQIKTGFEGFANGVVGSCKDIAFGGLNSVFININNHNLKRILVSTRVDNPINQAKIWTEDSEDKLKYPISQDFSCDRLGRRKVSFSLMYSYSRKGKTYVHDLPGSKSKSTVWVPTAIDSDARPFNFTRSLSTTKNINKKMIKQGKIFVATSIDRNSDDPIFNEGYLDKGEGKFFGVKYIFNPVKSLNSVSRKIPRDVLLSTYKSVR